MADIFISYGHEDQETARMLAQALAGQRWSVWWDQSIPPGKTWADVVGKQLTAARCVLVLWSKTSVTKRWVLKEARFADKRGTLIPVLIEDMEPPFEFGDIQAANLKNWQGDVSHSGYTDLLESVSEVLSTPLPSTTDEQNAIGTKHLAVEGPTVSHYHSPEPIEGGQRTLDEPGSARDDTPRKPLYTSTAKAAMIKAFNYDPLSGWRAKHPMGSIAIGLGILFALVIAVSFAR